MASLSIGKIYSIFIRSLKRDRERRALTISCEARIKALADKYMGGKASGILTFGIKGGIEAGTKFIDALELITRLVNIGDAKSLACHPASTTHRQLNAEELASAGVTEDMVRLSIGIEHIDDILADIEQALAAAAG